jgi:Ser/Thr protein kinase RdoA (MazF antagonist)
MKPYHELTYRGKLRRLRTLVIDVLPAYDLDVKKVSFFTKETNTMFQVATEARDRYVMRVYSDEETTARENQAEMFWLDAIIRDTDIKVCEPVRRRDGGYISIACMDGVPKERRCVLFKWVPGRPLAENLTPYGYYQLGQTLAKLHDHAQQLNPLPASIQPKQWDKVFYYPDEPVVYNTAAYRQYFPPERIALLDEVIQRADSLFRQLYADSDGKMLIHGDLHF